MENNQNTQETWNILTARKIKGRWVHEKYKIVKGSENEVKKEIAILQTTDRRYQKGIFEFHYKKEN